MEMRRQCQFLYNALSMVYFSMTVEHQWENFMGIVQRQGLSGCTIATDLAIPGCVGQGEYSSCIRALQAHLLTIG